MKPASDEWCLLARFLEPTDAHVLQARLRADGIEAVLADQHLLQAHPLIAVAIGGVRVLVRAGQFARAREVVAALERGEYQLDEDFDVGPPDS